jgi:hypothetical protein
MKKVYMMLAVCALAFASCTKEYTCECTYTDTTGLGIVIEPVSYTFEAKKADAETTCEAYDASAGGLGWSCKLK